MRCPICMDGGIDGVGVGVGVGGGVGGGEGGEGLQCREGGGLGREGGELRGKGGSCFAWVGGLVGWWVRMDERGGGVGMGWLFVCRSAYSTIF